MIERPARRLRHPRARPSTMDTILIGLQPVVESNSKSTAQSLLCASALDGPAAVEARGVGVAVRSKLALACRNRPGTGMPTKGSSRHVSLEASRYS